MFEVELITDDDGNQCVEIEFANIFGFCNFSLPYDDVCKQFITKVENAIDECSSLMSEKWKERNHAQTQNLPPTENQNGKAVDSAY